MNVETAASAATTDELVGALDSRGVPFLTGGRETPRALALSDADLLLGLACDSDARVRLAVIPLLLVHPSTSTAARQVAMQLQGDAQLTFQFYYTAAHWLQREHHEALASLLGEVRQLPDLFSSELGLDASATEPQRALDELSKRHQVQSREYLNWRGTYEHAAQCLVKQLSREKAWQS